jgi:hypothetical protein
MSNLALLATYAVALTVAAADDPERAHHEIKAVGFADLISLRLHFFTSFHRFITKQFWFVVCRPTLQKEMMVSAHPMDMAKIKATRDSVALTHNRHCSSTTAEARCFAIFFVFLDPPIT